LTVQELKFRHGKSTVLYKRRKAKLDRRHLIVMFAGIRPIDSYEFDGRASRNSQSHWLWIKDKFHGQFAYYLCHGMDFSIEDAVVKLIEAELDRLGLTKDQCTLAGFSKGGFAALYLGIKYGFKNILASAPQLFIGSHARRHRPVIFDHMTVEGSTREQQILDGLLPEAIAADAGKDRNIYLFSSPEDQFHAEQIVPGLPLFSDYANFNYVETHSDLVNEHSDVTRYNLPLILSTLYALAENVPPRFGVVRNGQRLAPDLAAGTLADQQAAGEVVANLVSCRTGPGRLFPAGVAFPKGHGVGHPAAAPAQLVLTGAAGSFPYPLERMGNRSLYFKYFEDAFADYRYGQFRTPADAGIDVSGLPEGFYHLELEMDSEDGPVRVPLTAAEQLEAEVNCGQHLVRLRSDNAGSRVDKRAITSPTTAQSDVALNRTWVRGNLLHVEGPFAVRGVEMPDWSSGLYYLLLSDSARTYSFSLGTGRIQVPTDPFGDGLSDYTHAYFATEDFAGIDTSQLSAGDYRLAVSLSAAGVIATSHALATLRIRATSEGGRTVTVERPHSSTRTHFPAVAAGGRIVRSLRRRARRRMAARGGRFS
jgi:hypothetical protein